ncbi:MAG: hypothetical protein A2Y15_09240 [Clostridiales bacterium GWF2_36_10]|nr:MAG: hypothetical protein A2Y15_09240 [Clostridiales bacterium GWF2_36_10]HAN21436.1 hypothetical protein [Clostridiales bacterium]
MQRNTKKSNTAVIILLMLITVLTVLLASCVVEGDNTDPLQSIPEFPSEDMKSEVPSDDIISTASGFTEQPVIKDVKNITADVVVISGTCEEGAAITIKRGKEDVTVQSRNGYFIAEVTLAKTSTNLLEVTAVVEGKEESVIESVSAEYIATAEKRIDKFAVSIGMQSQLYFDSYLENFMGENLLTQTELRTFRDFVNGKVTSLEDRAKGQDVELIYVLVPDVTSIYPDIFGEDIVRETFTTRYSQISNTLSQTNATVIDMYDIFATAKDTSEFDIYRKNDSHLTEYGAYLVYQQIANELALKFPAAAPRTLEEFEQIETEAIGGDLITYLGITNKYYTESILDLEPLFDLKIGMDKESNIATINISDVKKYVSVEDNNYSIYNGTDNKIIGINDRFAIRTDRIDLPSALIFRDDSLSPAIDILAERFQRALVGRNGDFTINLTEASRHNSDNKNIVDYVIVIVSENNIENIMN